MSTLQARDGVREFRFLRGFGFYTKVSRRSLTFEKEKVAVFYGASKDNYSRTLWIKPNLMKSSFCSVVKLSLQLLNIALNQSGVVTQKFSE